MDLGWMAGIEVMPASDSKDVQGSPEPPGSPEDCGLDQPRYEAGST